MVTDTGKTHANSCGSPLATLDSRDLTSRRSTRGGNRCEQIPGELLARGCLKYELCLFGEILRLRKLLPRRH